MTINIRAIRLQAPASNTTQDYVIGSFGAVQAIIVFSGRSGDGTDLDGISASIGFWDTSAVVTTSTHSEHGVLIASARAGNGNDNIYVVEISDHSGVIDRRAIPSTITDGIRLTWSGADDTVRPWTVVILINGINGAKAGALTPGDTEGSSATETGMGITPKVIFGCMNRTNLGDGSIAHKVLSLGFAHDTGSGIDQKCFSWKRQADTVADIARNATDRIAIDWSTSNVGSAQEITAMASGQFTSFTRDGSGAVTSDLFYLALDFDEEAEIFQSQVPTTDVDFVPLSGASFTPTAAIMVPSFAATLDNTEGDESAGFMGLYVCTEGEEFGFGFCDEDFATTNSNSSSRSDTKLIIQNDIAGLELTADTPVYTPGTITFDKANVGEASAAFYVTGIAFGGGAPVEQLSMGGVIITP